MPSYFLFCQINLDRCGQRRQKRIVLLFLAGGENKELKCELRLWMGWGIALEEPKWRQHLVLDSSAAIVNRNISLLQPFSLIENNRWVK